MNKKLIISLSTIAAITIIAVGATVGYFSNTETSSGNTFIAGAIDLKVDNECIINGQIVQDCTWSAPIDLKGKAIFNLTDVKPGDTGEDTISLHVDSNPAWVCAEISNVTQTENECNLPESKVDITCGDPGVDEGELWNNLTFSIWMDNGAGENACNNIKDEDETYLVENAPATNLEWPIADSQHGQGPITDACIGVAWSVPAAVNNIIQGDSVTGDITFKAYQARHNENFVCNPPTTATLTVIKHVINNDGGNAVAGEWTMDITGTNPSNNNFPGQESPGVTITLDPGSYSVDESGGPSGYSKSLSADCSGTIAAGETKTCTVTNDDQASTLIVRKIVSGGDKVASDFSFQINGGTITPFEADGQNDIAVNTGTYDVTEPAVETYTTSYDNCDDVVIDNGETETCTITNTYKTGTVTIHKVVENNGVGTKQPSDFTMTLDGEGAAQDTKITEPVGNHIVSEANSFGYNVSFSGDCDEKGNVNVGKDEDKYCTVTNTMPYGTITVTKTVTNNNGGLLQVGDFTLRIDGITVTSGVSKNVAVGAHNVDEKGVFGYSATVDGDCADTGDITIAAGDNKTCTIINDDIAPNITLVKNVSGGSALPDDFDVSIDHVVKTSGSSYLVSANTAHVIDEEVMVSGYGFTSLTGSSYLGVSCPGVLEGTITLLPGDIVTCTITNTHQ
jgi:hypothetical protein